MSFVRLLDALHVALTTHALYHYLIDLFGDYTGLDQIVWSLILVSNHEAAPNCNINLASNTYRCNYYHGGPSYVRSQDLEIRSQLWENPTVVYIDNNDSKVLNVTVAFGTGIFSIYDIYSSSSFGMLPDTKASICFIYSIPPIVDFIITFAMFYYLHKCRDASSFSSTYTIVLGLMRLIVLSGFATSTCALLTLITYLVWPDSLIFLGIELVLPKLFINSLLVMLNFRPERWALVNCGPSGTQVMRFKPDGSVFDTSELDIGIAMESVQSSDHRKEISITLHE
ncbi:hypothetical protein EDD85DRAFT_958562 [Armillaria nabsnona]|nr:hypothetical protein EDD85DRAFT_958562 [Armillaria nabsnona]